MMGEEQKPRRSTRARSDAADTGSSSVGKGKSGKDAPKTDSTGVKSPNADTKSSRKGGGLSEKGSNGGAKKGNANTGSGGNKAQNAAKSGKQANNGDKTTNASDKASNKADKPDDKSSKNDNKSDSKPVGNTDTSDKKGAANVNPGGKADAAKDDAAGDKKGDTAPDNKGEAGKAGDAAKGEAKSAARGANATGVDYSDKGLKDQLEHQAADVAMDATPILGQMNSARKVLKDANKKKREATGQQSDDIADKVEKGADKVVDGGIKGVKIAAGTVAGGTAGAGIGAGILAMKALMMLKGMVTAAAGKLVGMIAGAVQAVSSFISTVMGVGTTAANALAAGIAAMLVASTAGLGFGVMNSFEMRDPGSAACLPETEKVPAASQEYVEGGGDAALLQEEAAKKLWSVYSELGASKEQTAAVLGNLHHESQGLDPTATESIYDEKYHMGPKKMQAMAHDYDVDLILPSYGAEHPAIKYMGIGLAQWTNERNRLLLEYAESQGANWYDFDTQVKFMLAGDQEYRQEQLTDFLAADPGLVDVEAERFMNTWIGLSGTGNGSLSIRKEEAVRYLLLLEMAEADTNYAETILSGLNVNRGEGNSAAGSFYWDDGCGEPIATHYRGKEVDGTGEVPSGLTLVPWTRETLPEGLKAFAVDPSLAGLSWGNATGWANDIYADQCVALATSYFMKLYPDWNKNGRTDTRPFGNGKDTAPGWANHYGESTTDVPQAGAVFSDKTTSVYGHTGIVQHVFANGDILIVEQNVRGASGAANNMSYSWSWRVIQKNKYQQNNYVFFKPSDAEPRWANTGPEL